MNDKKGHNFMNDKMILSISNYDLFMNDTVYDLCDLLKIVTLSRSNCNLFMNDTI